MTAPAVQGRADAASATSDSALHTITLPSGIVAGERLVVLFSVDSNPTCSVDEGYSGRGWEKIGQASYSSDVTCAVFAKVAEGGSPAADQLRIFTTTAQQSSHIAFRIDAANIVEATFASGSSTNSDPPSHALAAGPSPNPDVLWIAGRSGDSTVVATGAPSGYSTLTTRAAGGTGGASSNTAEKTATAASEDPGTFTSNTEQWVAATIAVYNGAESAARVSQVAVEAIGSADPVARVSAFCVEVLSTSLLASSGAKPAHLVIAT